MKKLPFLWEIGCEEIPASWLSPLIAELRERLARELDRVALDHEKLEAYGTLRRLVVQVPKLAEKQEDREETVTGPPLKIARDDEGSWTKAALGFAKKNGIDPKKLEIVEKQNGKEYVGFHKKVKGRRAVELLPRIMAATLRNLAFPKFMNWDAVLSDGKGPFPFGRPIRWMVGIFGTKVVPLEILIEGGASVKTGRKSYGHRFLAPEGAKPGAPFTVSTFRSLAQGLKKNFVILDPLERRTRLEKAVQKLEKKAKAKRAPGLDTDLVAQLVEWPGAVLGTYPKEFLALPDEVRHTVLIHHQHYFPLEGRPSFVAVTNVGSDPHGYIRRGSERVVVARLRDAKFFWDDDLARPLAERGDELEGILFHKKLGSYRRKVERMLPLAQWIAHRCHAREIPVRRAVELSKCDLLTGMVGEFPELQGVMGGIYSREQREPEAVWKAVYSHYYPLGLGEDDPFPLNREGVVVSLSDKLDTLASMFSAGVAPTGSRDPFGLRRAALGVIRLLLESEQRLDFPLEVSPEKLLQEALRIVGELHDEVDAEAPTKLREFFVERLRYVFERDFRYDEVNAVFALGALTFPLTDLRRRLEAIRSLRGSEDFEALSIAFKRVRNILSDQSPNAVDPALFVDEEEDELYQALRKVSPRADMEIQGTEYDIALKTLSTLRPQVDRFFDEVFVMAEDETLRANRLALLNALDTLFNRVADLSEIVVDSSQ